MTTTTKPEPRKATDQHFSVMAISAEMLQKVSETYAEENGLLDSDEPITGATLRPSMTIRQSLEQRGLSIHSWATMLERIRFIHQIRKEFCSAEKLAAAKSDLAQAAQVELTEVPRIEAQIKPLEAKREEIIAQRIAAERALELIEGKRQQIRGLAPQTLVDHVEAEISYARANRSGEDLAQIVAECERPLIQWIETGTCDA